MGNLGMTEILLILVIALIIFGPRKLPELGRSLGQSLAQFRRASEDFKRQWEEEVDIEQQRLNAPPPEVQPAGNIASAAEQRGEMWDMQSGESASEQTDEQTEISPAADAPTVTIPGEQTISRETKRDWM